MSTITRVASSGEYTCYYSGYLNILSSSSSSKPWPKEKASSSIPNENVPQLMDDVLIVIFSQLQVPDLLKVRIACHHWNDLYRSGRIFNTQTWMEKEIEPRYIHFRSCGRDSFDKEDWKGAIDQFTRALMLNPRDHLSYFWRAYSFAESENYDAALKDFTKSLDLDPQDATTYSNRGATYRDVGEHEKALKDLEVAIKLDPSSASAYNNRGVVFGDMGQLEDAVKEYSKAIEVDPTHVIAIRNRGRRYQKMGRTNEALEDFSSLLKLNSKDAEALRFFVTCEIKGIFGYTRPAKLRRMDSVESKMAC